MASPRSQNQSHPQPQPQPTANITQKPTTLEFSNIKPILGSDLKAVQVNAKKRSGIEQENGKGKAKVTCGVKGIDENVMIGGFERGCVVGVSGDLGGGGFAVGRLITMHLIASVVLQSHEYPSSISAGTRNTQLRTTTEQNPSKRRAKARAAIIDTTGSFPLPLLQTIIQKGILEIYNRKSDLAMNAKEVDEIINDCLNRVSYSRALDFVGVIEAVREVGERCKDVEKLREERRRGILREKALRIAKGEEKRDKGRRKRKVGEGGVVEIGDSDEDDDSEEFDDSATAENLREDGAGNEDEEMTEILVLDNFTNMAGSLFGEMERDAAHALISTLTQILHNITKTHTLLTLLLNSTTPLSPSISLKSNTNANTYTPPSHPNRSIFTSTATTLRPSFEKTFDQLPDLHLFLSRLPKTRRDAEVLYGGDDEEEGYGEWGSKEVEYCHVIEVLRDGYFTAGSGSESEARLGEGEVKVSREQRWAPFAITGDGVGIGDVLI